MVFVTVCDNNIKNEKKKKVNRKLKVRFATKKKKRGLFWRKRDNANLRHKIQRVFFLFSPTVVLAFVPNHPKAAKNN